MPCNYLGLPLSIRKLRRSDLQPVLDKLASKLSPWKARLMSREGRALYVQVVLTASVVYQLMALELEPWFLQEVDKLRRGFLWAGHEEANGGSCAVAWHLVCQPKYLGGLGIHNLRLLNTALRAKWLWLAKTDPARPWHGLDVEVSKDSRALFQASIHISVGAGSGVLFWEDAWIGGLTAATIAPVLVTMVRPAVRRKLTVADGMDEDAWARGIAGELTVEAIADYLRLWSAIRGVHRLETTEVDSFRWKWTKSGVFSSRTAYRALFHGTTALPGATNVWHSFAPLKFKLHAWLALRRRCWTADRRLRRGLRTHVMCPLCGTSRETMDHLSLRCPFARAVWTGVITRLHLPQICPSDTAVLEEWWPAATARFFANDRKAANSLIMLVLRTLWLERNARVFEQTSTSAQTTLSMLLGEWNAWVECRSGFLRDID
jgi:hypothetical protein